MMSDKCVRCSIDTSQDSTGGGEDGTKYFAIVSHHEERNKACLWKLTINKGRLLRVQVKLEIILKEKSILAVRL